MAGCCFNPEHSELKKRVRMLEVAIRYADESLEACQDALLECRAGQPPVTTFDNSHWSAPEMLTGDEVALVLLANLPHWDDGVSRLPMDSVYRVASDEEIVEWLFYNRVNERAYVAEFGDCDKSAAKVWADYRWDTTYNNCGFVDDFSGGHAYNIWVRRNGGLWICEPQSDKVWDTGDADAFRSNYPLREAVILL